MLLCATADFFNDVAIMVFVAGKGISSINLQLARMPCDRGKTETRSNLDLPVALPLEPPCLFLPSFDGVT